MKLVNLFRSFLADTVNLNQDRITKLENNVEALQNFVRQCEWGPEINGFEPQGSWAHDTIIKPVDGGEFDADLLVMVEPVDGWTAADYVATLGNAFADSKTYGDKVKTWDYCITITYPHDRKVDIAPCVVGRKTTDQREVCNRKEDRFERSEPVAYTVWLKQRNTWSGANSFRKVTRLLKYLRDIKMTFTCPSVLLTTLLGMQIFWYDKDSDEFADTPTTLKTVIGRLDTWLQVRETKPEVPNPKLGSEDFAAVWTETQYSNFRNFIHKYRGWIDEAYDETDRTESIKAWRRVFGDNFAKGEAITARMPVSEGATLVKRFLLSTGAHLSELVDAIKTYGLAILPDDFNSPVHMHQPPWRALTSLNANIRVAATWHRSRDSEEGQAVQSGDILRAQGGLWLEAFIDSTTPIPDDSRVQWRITNTGAVAFNLKAMRGEFNAPHRGNRRWEELSYRGIHIAEAFIIRRSDDVLVAKSRPFNVVIE